MKLLILKPSSLGDIVHALIAVQAIKTQRPDAHITWVIRDTFAPLLQSVALVDKVITFNRKGGMGEFWRLLREIRRDRYDASLDMQGLLRTGLMNLFARAPLKLCRRDQREGAQFFANKIVNFPENSRHAVDLLMEFLPPLGLEKGWAPLKLKETQSPSPRPISHFSSPISSPPPLPPNTILIFPSSRGKWANKEWPFFKELTVVLLKENLGPVAWCSDIKLEVPAGALDFCQKIPLKDLLPFIAQARLLIGNDAGPTHMAAALGIPTIGLYGPTDPALAGAYPLTSPTNRNLRAPSGKMRDLGVQEVLNCVRKMIA